MSNASREHSLIRIFPQTESSTVYWLVRMTSRQKNMLHYMLTTAESILHVEGQTKEHDSKKLIKLFLHDVFSHFLFSFPDL